MCIKYKYNIYSLIQFTILYIYIIYMYNAIYQNKGNVSTGKNVNECNNLALFYMLYWSSVYYWVWYR
jgi:hypothetical protein